MWAWQVARQKGEKKDGKNAAIEYRSPGWVTCSSCCSGSFSGFPSSQFAWSQKQQRGLGTTGWGNWARAEQAEQFRVIVVWQTLSRETSPLTAAIQLSNTALHFLSPHSPHPTTAHPHRKVNSEPDKCRARGCSHSSSWAPHLPLQREEGWAVSHRRRKVGQQLFITLLSSLHGGNGQGRIIW